jgi:hypothetical protein
MTIRVPPRSATWLLKNLGPGYRNESLSGDLYEEYQHDRTPAWYWRQTAVAIVTGRLRGLRVRLPKFVLTAVLRVLIELAAVFGGIALAQSKAPCSESSRTCHSNPAPVEHSLSQDWMHR